MSLRYELREMWRPPSDGTMAVECFPVTDPEPEAGCDRIWQERWLVRDVPVHGMWHETKPTTVLLPPKRADLGCNRCGMGDALVHVWNDHHYICTECGELESGMNYMRRDYAAKHGAISHG